MTDTDKANLIAEAVNEAAAAALAPPPDADRGYLAAQLGEGLTKARETTGKSQRAAARDLGIANNTLRELELGHANPTLARIEELALAVGVRVRLVVTRRK